MILSIARAYLVNSRSPVSNKSVFSYASAVRAIAAFGGLAAFAAVGYYSMRQEASFAEKNGADLWFSLQGIEALLKTLSDP